MTIVSINYPTGAFATGILCDDYAFIYSNTFEAASNKQGISYVFSNSGGAGTSGINWAVEVTNDVNESVEGWHILASGTILDNTTESSSLTLGNTWSRGGMRPDYSTCTPISGFAWVGVHA